VVPPATTVSENVGAATPGDAIAESATLRSIVRPTRIRCEYLMELLLGHTHAATGYMIT
jgi:hypothetical protein